MLAIILAFLASVAVTGWIVGWGGPSASPRVARGPQTFHLNDVPRFGGAGVLCGLAVGAGLLAASDHGAAPLASLLLVSALPVCVTGLVEDHTQTVSPRRRLFASAVSAVLAIWLLEAQITRIDIPVLDAIASVTAAALALTVVTVVGVTNAVNIIDGFNGLASMCVVIMLGALACVAFQVGDSSLVVLALAGIAAALGFFVWNFPRGLVFLGDGGAYLLGFFLAELSILLLLRNPEVSPLCPLLICAYPVFETLFSIFRRCVLHSRLACDADAVHLHSLIYRRVTRWALPEQGPAAQPLRNSMTSPVLWLLCAGPALAAVLFRAEPAYLAIALLVFVVAYTQLYWRLVRFRTPRWLKLLRLRKAPVAASRPARR